MGQEWDQKLGRNVKMSQELVESLRVLVCFMRTRPININHSYQVFPQMNPSSLVKKTWGASRLRFPGQAVKLKFRLGCTFLVYLQDFTGTAGKQGPPHARRLPHDLHPHGPVESRAGVCAAARPFPSSAGAAPCGQVPAAEPGAALPPTAD